MGLGQPELKKYLDKRIEIHLNGGRRVVGTLRGYDVFLNLTIDEVSETKKDGERVRMGMCVIRGNSVNVIEALERMD